METLDQLTHVLIADVKKAGFAFKFNAIHHRINLAEVAAGIKTNISWLLDAAFWDVY